jgi:hypothetical protein
LETHAFGDVSHTGDNLNIYFQATQDRWGLEDKVEVIVTDNASNITNGVEFSEHKSIRCAAHTLQLAVNDCLEDKKIKDLLKKCRAIVTLFRQSTKLNEKLKKKQEKTNLNELKLIQDV